MGESGYRERYLESQLWTAQHPQLLHVSGRRCAGCGFRVIADPGQFERRTADHRCREQIGHIRPGSRQRRKNAMAGADREKPQRRCHVGSGAGWRNPLCGKPKFRCEESRCKWRCFCVRYRERKDHLVRTASTMREPKLVQAFARRSDNGDSGCSLRGNLGRPHASHFSARR